MVTCSSSSENGLGSNAPSRIYESEIFQIQETSTINDYGQADDIKRDINCNLGSLNIVNVMESKRLQDSVHVGMEMLTIVSDMSNVANAPTVQKANEELHSVGLGDMNLHGYLAKNRINYESDEAKEFVSAYYMTKNFYSIEKSMLMAKERGYSFKDFDRSDYAKGTYFHQYLTNNYHPTSDKVVSLFDGIYLPTQEDWMRLMREVQKHGMINALNTSAFLIAR